MFTLSPWKKFSGFAINPINQKLLCIYLSFLIKNPEIKMKKNNNKNKTHDIFYF